MSDMTGEIEIGGVKIPTGLIQSIELTPRGATVKLKDGHWMEIKRPDSDRPVGAIGIKAYFIHEMGMEDRKA